MTTVGTLNVKVTADTDGLQRQVSGAGTKSATGFAGTFKKAVGPLLGAAAFAGVVKGIGSTVSAASDLGESMNAVNVMYEQFGKDAPAAVEKLSKAAAKEMGLSRTEFNSAAVSFGGFIKQMGKDGDDATSTLGDLTQRAADFASVNNLEVGDAANKFRAALAGSSEVMMQYGINISMANVEQFAYANGIAETGEKLTEAEKVQARYGLLMQETANTQGDFSNTSDSLANRMREVKASFENAKAGIGQAFLPIVEKVANFISDKVVPAFETFAGWINNLFDGGGAEGASQWFDTLRGGFETVVGFIRDNVVPIFTTIFDRIRDTITKVGDVIRERIVPVFEAFVEKVREWAPTIREIVEAVLGVVRNVYDKVYGIMSWLIPIIAEVIAWIVEKLVPVFTSIIDVLLNNVWPAVKQAFEWISEKWATVVKAVTRFWEDTLRPTFEAVWRFVSETVWPILKRVFEFIGAAWSALVAGIKMVWENILRPLFTFVGNVVEVLWGIVKAVFKAWQIGWEVLVGAIKMVWDRVLRPVFDAVGGFIRDTVWPIIKTVFEWIADKWSWLNENVIQPVWDWVKANVFDKIAGVMESVKGAFRSATDGIGTIWARLKALAAKPIYFILDTVINNGLIRLLNNVIEFFTDNRPISPISIPGALRQAANPSYYVNPYGGAGGSGHGHVGPTGGIDFAGTIGAFGKFLTDPAGALADLVSSIWTLPDNPFVQALYGVPKKLIGYAVDWFRNLIGVGDATGEVGYAGSVLPAGSYTIGMPYLGYPGHYGADYPAPRGTKVYAATAGVVRTQSLTGSYGKWISLAGPGGVETRYAHLQGFAVPSGAVVDKGQLIGYVNSTGNSTGDHLHFEWRQNGAPINPASLGLFDRGGWLPHGAAAMNLSGHAERVLSPAESARWDNDHARDSIDGATLYLEGMDAVTNRVAARIVRERGRV